MEKVIVLLNHWGEIFSSFTGAMLLQTTVLILVLGIGDFIAVKRLRSTVRYAIWMLLLLKLVLPVTFSLPTGLMRFNPPSPKGQIHADLFPALANDWVVGLGFRAADVTHANELSSRFIAPAHSVAAVPRRASDAISLSFRAKLMVGWMVGVTGLAIWMILRTKRVCALASSGFTPSAELVREFELCVRRLRINARVSLRLTSEKIQPGIYGLFTPTVLLPATLCDALEPAQLRAIFLHELTHLKRGDLFVNLVQTVVQVLYFYNPLLWLANRHIRRIREEAVDEAVLISMGEHASCYASTLVNVAKLTLANRMGTVGTIGILESDSSLGIRVKRMLSRPFPSSARVGIRGCVITAILGLILLPMAPAERLGAARPAYATNDLKGATAKPERHENIATNSINPLALLKTQNLDELFKSYEAHGEMRKRSQKATAAEILSRPNAIDFLTGKLKRNGSGSYSETEQKSRVKAIVLIGNAGPRGIAALPSLVSALEDEERIRRAATLAIGDLGPSGSTAIPILKEELRFQNPSAAQALFKITPNSTETLNLILDCLQDNSTPSGFRSEILNSLWLTQLQTPRLLAVLNALPEENPALKEDVSRLLEKFRPIEQRSSVLQFPRNKYEKKDLPALSQRLKASPNDFDAASGIRALGPDAIEALPLLIELVAEKKVRFVGNFVSMFGALGPAAVQALPLVMELALSDDAGVAQNSIVTLGQMGPAASASTNLLGAFLTDSDPSFRFAAANALRKIDPSQTFRCVPILVQSFEAGRKDTYQLLVFGELGPLGKSAIPFILESLRTGTRDERVFAALTILKIDGTLAGKTLPVLNGALQDASFPNRHLIANALGDLGVPAASSLPFLKSMAEETEGELQRSASDAVTKIEVAQRVKRKTL